MSSKSVRCKGRQQTGGEIEYKVVPSDSILAAEGARVGSYGIAVYRKGRKLRTVEDITIDRERLEQLVCLCNRCRLSLCHLEDVIEDFLAQL